MEASIKLHQEGGLATLTLDNPGKLNAINLSMWRELHRVMDQVSRDESVRCVILRGAGDHFAAGGDLEEFQTLRTTLDQALVYHCAAGKDRTGVISILILMALSVDDKTIAEDYLLTDELYDFSIEKQHPTNEKLSQVIAKMNVTRGEGPAVKGITETIRQGWGSFDKFFTRKLGFKQADLEKFREMYLEEEEED